MPLASTPQTGQLALGGALVRLARSWWGVLYVGLLALVTALTPSTYHRANRATTARLMYTTTWQVLPWFTLLSALISLVLIRIVVVTALSYGLSQYALDLVVRVLVLELIPLSAALFVVLRAALGVGGAADRSLTGEAQSWLQSHPQRMRDQVVPRVIASAFSVITLASVSSVVALILAYMNVYGLSPWGFDSYTRMVGRVFEPSVSVNFVLKVLLFGLAVAVIPVATVLQAQREPGATAPNATVRLFVILVVIEGLSLALKYV